MRIRHWSTMTALAVGAAACAELQAPLDEQAELELAETSAALVSTSTATEATFTAFESGQVRPLALSADGKLLFAVNTPDNRLEVFTVGNGTLKSKGAVMVGLEPVAVAVRSAGEVWVVNHLSDSISIVDVSNAGAPRVTRTLLVGDEPRDIVFAKGRAYVTTAHRGQNTGRDPQLTTPGVGRADVWVFNPAALGDTLGGTPLTVITLFTDTPRALAVSKDQNTVYAAGFNTQNRTAILPERIATNFGGGLPPFTNANGDAAPAPALIVKFRLGNPDGQYHWLDESGRIWDTHMRFALPDKDVFAIDASLAVPAEKPAQVATGVGTVIFNLAVNPVSGKVYASNLESRNDVRFEGHNEFGGGTSVRGHIAESRITVIAGGAVTPRHLNKHIDFSQEGTPAENAKSLASPTGIEVSKDGKLLYVAALSSNKLGVYRTAELEADTFVPNTSDQVALSGGGPTGLALDASNKFAYVLTRFDNGISIVNTQTKSEIGHVKMYNPEPASITNGRRFLYDAALTSAHGDSACATCHIFGDLDALVWELGDPDGTVINNPGTFTTPPAAEAVTPPDLHPMKGPMATQSLRGMANHGPMHWRGDRTGGNDVPASAQPDTGTFNEDVAFKKFNVAFPGLLGRAAQLSDAEMQAFTDFMLQVMYPPNPIRNLDNSLTAAQAAGRAFYFNSTPTGQEIPSDTFHNCNGCHILNPAGNAEFGVAKPGFFGSDGRYSFVNGPQFIKVPHIRNMYQKVGMFGLPNTFGLPIDRLPPLPPTGASLPPPLNDVSFMGDQIKGFGFTHNGDRDTLFRFFGSTAFVQRPVTDAFPNPGGIPPNAAGMQIRRDVEAFVLAADSNLAPIVGQQITLRTNNAAVVDPRIALLKQRAAAAECELVVRGVFGGVEVGALYVPATGKYALDLAGTFTITEAQLRAALALSPLTFTAVPPNSGKRIAFDRDSNGALDVNGVSTLRSAGVSAI
jgi:DNA-binding beta-propeller fold protein YncE